MIVIRSLVPGGVAQLDGRLVPGDRLIFVNDVNLENATLDEAVQALKGAPKGVVKIGVAKPLPFSGAPHQMTLEPTEPVQDIQVGTQLCCFEILGRYTFLLLVSCFGIILFYFAVVFFTSKTKQI